MFICYSRKGILFCSKKDSTKKFERMDGSCFWELIYKVAWDWSKVTCPKCLKNKSIQNYFATINKNGFVCKYVSIKLANNLYEYFRLCKTVGCPININKITFGSLNDYDIYPSTFDDEDVTCPKCLRFMK